MDAPGSLSVRETKAAGTKGPMKKISDLFTDEEKKQLSYLGSMLHQEPSQEDIEADEMFDLIAKHGMKIYGEVVKPGD